MTASTTPAGECPTPPSELPRLLSGIDGRGPASLTGHLGQRGQPPAGAVRRGADVILEIDRAGLRGRGGAWFPTATKWRAVTSRGLRRPVVVANGAEAEPASGKDRLLLERAPHLVLDGAALAATTVGAAHVFVYAPPRLAAGVAAAVAERNACDLDPVPIQVVEAATTFVAGEESAAVAHLNGGLGGRPTFTAVRPVYERGVNGAPTLVQNTETLAHAALIGRFGAAWFRRIGTPGSPGTALLTIVGPGQAPTVVEVALGTRLGSTLGVAGVDADSAGAVLVGGFGGTWLPLPAHADAPLCEEGLRRLGATLGAGVVGVLSRTACPLAETAHIAAYLADQSAGQCGPCLHGLPALASAVARLAWAPRRSRGLVPRMGELCGVVERRGACHHPDGAARLVRSALAAFPGHVEAHLRDGPCRRAFGGPALPVPGGGHRMAAR